MTIDKFQGSDIDCVILLLVVQKSNNNLLEDWRRINVAITRAKKKLISKMSVQNTTIYFKSPLPSPARIPSWSLMGIGIMAAMRFHD